MTNLYVYGIRFGKYVKFGCTQSPSDRLRALPGNLRRPDDLIRVSADVEPLFAVPGDYLTERLLHDLFEPHRAMGEWYHYEPLAETMDRIRLSSDRLTETFRLRTVEVDAHEIAEPGYQPLPAPVDF
jgi:hypothetical protein